MAAYETMLAETRKHDIKKWEDHRKSARKLLGPPMTRIEGTANAAYMQAILDGHAIRHGTKPKRGTRSSG